MPVRSDHGDFPAQSPGIAYCSSGPAAPCSIVEGLGLQVGDGGPLFPGEGGGIVPIAAVLHIAVEVVQGTYD